MNKETDLSASTSLERRFSAISWNANLIDVQAVKAIIELLDEFCTWDVICVQEGFSCTGVPGYHEVRSLDKHAVYVGVDVGGRRAPMIIIHERWVSQSYFLNSNSYCIGAMVGEVSVFSIHLPHTGLSDDTFLSAVEDSFELVRKAGSDCDQLLIGIDANAQPPSCSGLVYRPSTSKSSDTTRGVAVAAAFAEVCCTLTSSFTDIVCAASSQFYNDPGGCRTKEIGPLASAGCL